MHGLEEQTEMIAQDSPWDAEEESEIVAHIPIDYESCISYEEEKAGIKEGLCFGFNKFLRPFRWEDLETETRASHLAVSQFNVMYLKDKYAKHKLNPCPPCMCFNEASYREDFEPKTKKTIPLEKITDIEVQEAGSNELVPPPGFSSFAFLLVGLMLLAMPVGFLMATSLGLEVNVAEDSALVLFGLVYFLVQSGPRIDNTGGQFGCNFPPKCNPISMELPVSKALVNTAGSSGPELIIDGIEDANGFRRLIMNLKKGGSSFAPRQQAMSMQPATLGANSEVLSLLRDIAKSRREMVELLQP